MVTLQIPGLFAVSGETIPVAIGSPELIEVPENLKYFGSNLMKNLCTGISRTAGYELASCGLKIKNGTTTYTIDNVIRSENQQLRFEAIIRDGKGQVLATIKGESGEEQYHALMLESHGQAILARLSLLLSGSDTQEVEFSTAHLHDKFYFNAIAGTGWSAIENFGMGGAGLFGIKLGGAITNHVILFGAMDMHWLYRPIIKTEVTLISNQSIKLSGNLDGSILIPAFSAGAAYYTDNNYFFSSSLGISTWYIFPQSSKRTVGSAEGNAGWNLSLAIGKEWWMSDDWGVGVSLIATGVKDMYSAGRRGNFRYFLGIAVTATYN
jgi:hypothetical protein